MSGWGNNDSSAPSNVDWSEGKVANDSFGYNSPAATGSNDRPQRTSEYGNNNGTSGYGNNDRSSGYGNNDGPSGYGNNNRSSGYGNNHGPSDYNNGPSNYGNNRGPSSYGNGGDSDRPPRAPPSNYKWASSKRRYEWKSSYEDGDSIAPRDEELEKELFGEDSHVHTGLNFDKYESIPTSVRGDNPPSPVDKFEQCDLHPVMKENIALARYTTPTPVQRHSIPIVTAGRDLMACAQTGSGKTAAFLVPTLSALFGRARELANPRPMNSFAARSYRAEPLVLILAPTRELCSQTFDECRRFCYRSMLRPCAIYGGAESFPQKLELEKGCDILAATPGRLQDFIQRGKVGLNRVKYLILDEADRMLDMGFESSIRDIVEQSGMNADRQTLMYSATFPRTIRKLARDFLKPEYLFLKVGRVGGTTTNITQKVFWVEEEEKRDRIKKLLLSQPPSRTLIFVETKRGADSLDQYLFDQSFPTTSIHGDRTQMEREDALIAFKNGKCPILVATAVAARGLDVRNVMHVINYDMTNDLDEYIHRIGRTARVGNSGLATTFFNDRNIPIAPELTKVLQENKQEIPDFMKEYMSTDLTFAEDMDEDNVDLPSYAKQGLRRNDFGGASGGNDGPNWFDNSTGGGSSGYGNQPSYGGGDRDGGRDGGYGSRQGPPPAREGDWNCPSCNANNFSRRSECFKCQTGKPEGAGGYGGSGGYGGERRPRPAPGPGDWECSSCGVSNFARRGECFKCNAPKKGGASNGGYGGGYGGGNDNQTNEAPSWGAEDSTPSWDTTANTSNDAPSWDTPAAAPAAGNDSWETPAAAPTTGNDSWGASEPTPAKHQSWGGNDNVQEVTKGVQQIKVESPVPAAAPIAAPIAAPTVAPIAAPAGDNGWGAPAASGDSSSSSNWNPNQTPW